MEYVLKSRPGYSPHAVYQNPTSENSDIFEFDGMVFKTIHPVNPETLRMFKPVMGPEFYRVEKFGKVALDRELPAGRWACGSSPYTQAIWKTVYDKHGATFEDIFRSLASDYRIVPLNERSRRMIEAQVGWMYEPGGPSYLIMVEGKYRVGIVPHCDAPLVEQRPGYCPIEWETYNFTRERGMASYAELRRYVFDVLKWLKDEDYFRSEVIKKLLKAGNLVEVAKEHYRAERVLEPF